MWQPPALIMEVLIPTSYMICYDLFYCSYIQYLAKCKNKIQFDDDTLICF